MAANNRVSTKDLDSRLKAVEDRLGELAETLARIEGQARSAQAEAEAAVHRSAVAEAAANRIVEARVDVAHHSAPNGDGSGESEDKILKLESVVGRLDERVEKITQTLIQQAHRFS